MPRVFTPPDSRSKRHETTHPESVREGINQLQPWFHNIELNGEATDPQNPDHPRQRWQAIAPDIPPDPGGKTVLDLGCASGYISVALARRGADVLAVDWEERAIAQVKFATEVLDLKIQTRLQNIYEFVLGNDRVFDYVLFMGVLYHLRHPLLILDQLARMSGKSCFSRPY